MADESPLPASTVSVWETVLADASALDFPCKDLVVADLKDLVPLQPDEIFVVADRGPLFTAYTNILFAAGELRRALRDRWDNLVHAYYLELLHMTFFLRQVHEQDLDRKSKKTTP